VKKGQEIDVVVLDINQDERRIALGHKQVEANPWDAFEDEYHMGTETKGKISRLIDKGVIVTLPLGVDAFVPLNHLSKTNIKRASDHFKVGDELPLKVIEFDKENKRIVLSVSEYLKGKEQTEVDQYLAEHNFTSTTMGELVKDVPEVLEGLPAEQEDTGRPAKKPKSKKEQEEKEPEAKTEVQEEVEQPVEAEVEPETKTEVQDEVEKPVEPEVEPEAEKAELAEEAADEKETEKKEPEEKEKKPKAESKEKATSKKTTTKKETKKTSVKKESPSKKTTGTKKSKKTKEKDKEDESES